MKSKRNNQNAEQNGRGRDLKFINPTGRSVKDYQSAITAITFKSNAHNIQHTYVHICFLKTNIKARSVFAIIFNVV